MFTEVRLVQFLKADSPIEVTDVGMMIEVKPELAKANLEIDVMDVGIVTEVNLVHPLKAASPIDFTVEGMGTAFKSTQFEKTPLPIDVIEVGIVNEENPQ